MIFIHVFSTLVVFLPHRDYRRYFYTHKLTGKTQWDYPDADDIKTEDAKAQEPKKSFAQGREPETEISSSSDKGKVRSMEKEILASMSLPPPPPPPAEEHPSVKSLQLMYGSSSDSENEEPSSKKIKKEPTTLQNVPLPLEEPHREKEKKDKHKKKKKKEKSKKKEKEKTEQGAVGPVGPVYPQIQPMSVQPLLAAPPPPPPPGEEPENSLSATGYGTVVPEAYLNTAGQEQHETMEVPVYGSVEDGQSGLNDQPLEFGTVQEPTGPHPYAEGMEGVDQAVISQGPQITTVSHEPETYLPVSTDAYGGGGEPSSEATVGEGNSEASYGAVPSTEEKKKKKKEKMGSGSISLKKKHVSSMVQKWQKVKKEVELEEQNRQIREAEIRRKLAELE